MKYLQILVLALLSGLAIAPAVAEDEGDGGSELPVLYQVQTAAVRQHTVDELLHVYGKVSFDDAWLQNISLAYAGQIIRLPVVAGEQVAKGQLLAEVATDPAAAAAWQQALSAVKFAQAEVDRMRSQLADQLATKSQLAAAEKAVADSQAQLHQLRQQGVGKGIRRILSPFPAVIAAIPVQAGQRVAAGVTLLQLGKPDRLKVLLGVEAEDVGSVAAGHPVYIHPAMRDDVKVTASVDQILRAINPQTRLVDVLVRLSGSQAKPFLAGMAVSADIVGRTFRDALIIPRQAVMYDAGAAYVMRIENGVARRVPVRILLEKDESVVVQGELAAGEAIATIGVAEVTDGDRVRVQGASKAATQ
ncbi:efflux RND transporter periplasmic adaptor subunit [Mariprofundus ferrooxydans]|uniref:Transporter, putative n=1 Tax=Mariprofundus ferrooxydans PV-1 TaxID=314345 RepID=Q0EXM0_9PROT|nr:efflux RND transporter periplasmic adaptor subunit [Mariprofundus ferrooxydans]EAU54027.1 transporter, putative [Mariprofundus ferrooxydans PV-1]KON46585.1 transporter [Mariprofundus ferrooxydans]